MLASRADHQPFNLQLDPNGSAMSCEASEREVAQQIDLDQREEAPVAQRRVSPASAQDQA
jgi:hypothetical protein